MSFIYADISILSQQMKERGYLSEFEKRIKTLTFTCFNKSAKGDLQLSDSIDTYPMVMGIVFLYVQNMSFPVINEKNSNQLDMVDIGQLINNITHILTLSQEDINETYNLDKGWECWMIWNVCKKSIDIEPVGRAEPMKILFEFLLNTWKTLTPPSKKALFLGIDLWNLTFSEAFDLYAKNHFEYIDQYNNHAILMKYNPISSMKTKEEIVQYRKQVLTRVPVTDPELKARVDVLSQQIPELTQSTQLTQPTELTQSIDKLSIPDLIINLTKRKSTKRKSTKRKSTKRKSTKRKSTKRKSTKRKSNKRKSTKRKSTKLKSTKLKSNKRKLIKRKSIKRKSIKRKSKK
jgi:hypothetical protein